MRLWSSWAERRLHRGCVSLFSMCGFVVSSYPKQMSTSVDNSLRRSLQWHQDPEGRVFSDEVKLVFWKVTSGSPPVWGNVTFPSLLGAACISVSPLPGLYHICVHHEQLSWGHRPESPGLYDPEFMFRSLRGKRSVSRGVQVLGTPSPSSPSASSSPLQTFHLQAELIPPGQSSVDWPICFYFFSLWLLGIDQVLNKSLWNKLATNVQGFTIVIM